MTPGKLPWDSIDNEVREAVRLFCIFYNLNQPVHINTRHLVEYIVFHSNLEHFPNLSGIPAPSVQIRCSTAMKRMGWTRWNAHVYVIPWRVKGEIMHRVLQENK